MTFLILGLATLLEANPAIATRLHAEHLCISARAVLPEMKMVDESHEMCVIVTKAAIDEGFPPMHAAYILATAYNESRFRRDARGAQGEIGPVQIKPKWWCPNGDATRCDPLHYGIRALAKLYLSKRYGNRDWHMALGMYNGGPKSPDWFYGDTVTSHARRVLRAYRRRGGRPNVNRRITAQMPGSRPG